MPQDNKNTPPAQPPNKVPNRNHDYSEFIITDRDSINKRGRVSPVQKLPDPTPKPKR